MNRLIVYFLVMFQGFNLMASGLSDAATGNDAGIYPLVIAFVVLVSAVIARLVSVKQKTKAAKRAFQN